LRDNIQNGKLTLTLADVTRMAVARNSEIWLARLDVQSSETPLYRAYAAFDPRFNGSFNSSFSSSPTASVLQASKGLNQNTQLLIQQTLPTGTTYSTGFSGTKSSSNNSFNILNPALGANLAFSVSQPLLRN